MGFAIRDQKQAFIRWNPDSSSYEVEESGGAEEGEACHGNVVAQVKLENFSPKNSRRWSFMDTRTRRWRSGRRLPKHPILRLFKSR
jgi:hypothetical protein